MSTDEGGFYERQDRETPRLFAPSLREARAEDAVGEALEKEVPVVARGARFHSGLASALSTRPQTARRGRRSPRLHIADLGLPEQDR